MDDEEKNPQREAHSEKPVEVSIDAESSEDFDLSELPDELPVLPLKNTVLFPFLLSPLLVNTARSQRLIDEVLRTPKRLMLVVAVRQDVEGSPGPQDIYRVGTVLRIVKMLKFPDASYRLLVQGVARCRIEDFTSEQPYLKARVHALQVVGDPSSVEIAALTRNVSQHFSSLVAESSRLSDELQALATNLDDPSKLADLVASNLDVDIATKQAVLEEMDLAARLRFVLAEVSRAREAVKVEGEIREKVQTEVGKTQREYMLRQQLEAIRRELGETEDAGEELDRLRTRIDAAGMPEEALKQANRELERLSQMPTAAAEHGVIRTYLEWMTDLPWSALSEDRLDVAEARKILDEDHYGLEKIKDRIVEYIAVLSLKKDLRGPILCFVGPPGTGKTSLGKSIARALDRKFVRISLGGVRDEAEIRGHRRTYVGAMPGRIIQGMRRATTRNPIFLLDEVDKVGADFRGDPSSALLEVLDPEQNSTFSDHYLEVSFNLSSVIFIATANVLDPIPAALRDRMEVIELPGYIEEEKLEIAKRYLVPRQLEANGVKAVGLEICDETLIEIIRSYTREAGVRNLEREIGTVARKIARRVAEENLQGPIVVKPEELAALLGPIRFESELADRAGRPGVAVGLAWTPAGGDILFIECTKMPGKGDLKLTGNLGGVMKESVEAARSWLRVHCDQFGIAAENFEKSDLHLHVPAGAIPKDGPSAGVGMVTALTSLFTGRSVPPDIAMTGEITLRGKVMPVGGIKEKVLAAKRAGIKKVVLPARNEQDVAEIRPELLHGLELIYVETIGEALQHTLALDIPLAAAAEAV